MFKSKWAVLFVVLVGFSLIGAQCGKVKRTVVKTDKKKAAWKKGKFVVDSVALDSKTKGDIKITGKTYAEVDERAKVEYKLMNTSRHTLNIECRIRFFDENDSEMESVLSFWHPYVLYPSETVPVSSIAPKAGARRAELSYRMSQKTK